MNQSNITGTGVGGLPYHGIGSKSKANITVFMEEGDSHTVEFIGGPSGFDADSLNVYAADRDGNTYVDDDDEVIFRANLTYAHPTWFFVYHNTSGVAPPSYDPVFSGTVEDTSAEFDGYTLTAEDIVTTDTIYELTFDKSYDYTVNSFALDGTEMLDGSADSFMRFNVAVHDGDGNFLYWLSERNMNGTISRLLSGPVRSTIVIEYLNHFDSLQLLEIFNNNSAPLRGSMVGQRFPFQDFC